MISYIPSFSKPLDFLTWKSLRTLYVVWVSGVLCVVALMRTRVDIKVLGEAASATPRQSSVPSLQPLMHILKSPCCSRQPPTGTVIWGGGAVTTCGGKRLEFTPSETKTGGQGKDCRRLDPDPPTRHTQEHRAT